jgi:hypothetical protein
MTAQNRQTKWGLNERLLRVSRKAYNAFHKYLIKR